jgi:hypothetical protein
MVVSVEVNEVCKLGGWVEEDPGVGGADVGTKIIHTRRCS